MAEPPKPIAEGSLAQTPLAHVLLSVMRKSMSGTLAVWPDPTPSGAVPEGQDRILFKGGRPVAARLIDRATALDRGMLPLFHRVRAPYAFYPADLVGERSEVLWGEIDPLALIVASLRGGAREDVARAVVARLGNGKLRLQPTVELRRFALLPKEQAVVDLLRAEPASVEELTTGTGDASMTRRVLYALTIAGCIEPAAAAEPAASADSTVIDPPSPPAAAPGPAAPAAPPAARPAPRSAGAPGGPEPPPGPPDGLTPELRLRWQQIADRAVAIDRQTYFEMLNVPRSAGADEIARAYVEQVKEWHPDRLPPPLRPLLPWVQEIFHHITQAKDTLSDDEDRKSYLKSVQEGGGTPEAERKVHAIVGAAVEFQKVEVLARRKQWDEGLALLESLLELSPDEADFHAMHGWLLFHKHGTGNEARVHEMLKALDRALELNGRNERAHFARGIVLKQLGRGDKALKHFRKVAEINPRHIEAQREVRLATMRSQKASGGDGLFSKLLGKKK